MAIHWAEPGYKAVGEYQLSGIPFVTSSILADEEIRLIEFPRVVKSLIVRNANTGSSATTMAVGFTANGIIANPVENTCFISLDSGESLSVDLRIKDLFLSNTRSDKDAIEYEILAGLTDISREKMFTLTGSSGFGGVG
tara:strand:- start:651 stop:1067 length:417 start_codon:yes stop_codon:yes gene_type:complete